MVVYEENMEKKGQSVWKCKGRTQWWVYFTVPVMFAMVWMLLIRQWPQLSVDMTQLGLLKSHKNSLFVQHITELCVCVWDSEGWRSKLKWHQKKTGEKEKRVSVHNLLMGNRIDQCYTCAMNPLINSFDQPESTVLLCIRSGRRLFLLQFTIVYKRESQSLQVDKLCYTYF